MIKIADFTLFFFIFVFSPSLPLAQSQLPDLDPQDKASLLIFRVSIHDLNRSLSTWYGSSCSNWTGLACQNPTGKVLSLTSSGLNLSGQIHPSLCKLSSLQSLDLSHNNFSGNIPSWLCKFDKIQMIDYSSNRFSWFIPDDNLNSTRFKDFQTGGGEGFAEPPGKVEIKISAAVVAKDELSFSYNLLSMVGIDLSDNLLHGEIPEALFRQKNIEYLNLSYNFLEGQLPRLEKLPRLKALDLSHNSLSGQVIGNISAPPGLTLLNLSHNCFSGIITEKEGLGKFPGALAGNPELCVETPGSKCDPANIDASQEEIYQNELVEGPISIWIFCLSAFISFDFGVLGIFCSARARSYILQTKA